MTVGGIAHTPKRSIQDDEDEGVVLFTKGLSTNMAKSNPKHRAVQPQGHAISIQEIPSAKLGMVFDDPSSTYKTLTYYIDEHKHGQPNYYTYYQICGDRENRQLVLDVNKMLETSNIKNKKPACYIPKAPQKGFFGTLFSPLNDLYNQIKNLDKPTQDLADFKDKDWYSPITQQEDVDLLLKDFSVEELHRFYLLSGLTPIIECDISQYEKIKRDFQISLYKTSDGKYYYPKDTNVQTHFSDRTETKKVACYKIFKNAKEETLYEKPDHDGLKNLSKITKTQIPFIIQTSQTDQDKYDITFHHPSKKELAHDSELPREAQYYVYDNGKCKHNTCALGKLAAQIKKSGMSVSARKDKYGKIHQTIQEKRLDSLEEGYWSEEGCFIPKDTPGAVEKGIQALISGLIFGVGGLCATFGKYAILQKPLEGLGNILSKNAIGEAAVSLFEKEGSKLEDLICKNYFLSSMVCLAGATFIAWKCINADWNDYTVDEKDLPYFSSDNADMEVQYSDIDIM